MKSFPRWPIVLLAAGAFVAVWSGWVGLGELAGFGVIHPLPGIWDEATINTAITLPIGLESYAAFALGAWLSGRAPARARTFAMCSAIGSLVLGACGQVAYHLLVANGATVAPPAVVVAVACIPVAVLGMGATLSHLMSQSTDSPSSTSPVLEDCNHGHADSVQSTDSLGPWTEDPWTVPPAWTESESMDSPSPVRAVRSAPSAQRTERLAVLLQSFPDSVPTSTEIKTVLGLSSQGTAHSLRTAFIESRTQESMSRED